MGLNKTILSGLCFSHAVVHHSSLPPHTPDDQRLRTRVVCVSGWVWVFCVSLPSSLELSEVLAGGTRIRPWLPGRPMVDWSTAARQAGAHPGSVAQKTILALEFPNSGVSKPAPSLLKQTRVWWFLTFTTKQNKESTHPYPRPAPDIFPGTGCSRAAGTPYSCCESQNRGSAPSKVRPRGELRRTALPGQVDPQWQPDPGPRRVSSPGSEF